MQMDPDKLYRIVGGNIRNARKSAGYSQNKLAELLGISRASIVNIEAGRQRPPLHVLWQIAGKTKTEAALLLPSQAEYDSQAEKESRSISLNSEEMKQIIEKAEIGDSDTKIELMNFVAKAIEKSKKKL